ncbi:MAG: hypothetical protein HOP12_14660, partial [Candidatus Eisenbacteria bacterium]|nr:hypothetical protein [Candidatus Eisenbacteria bacterium]
MKLLSDFDGVWTHPREEARVQGEKLEGALVGWGASQGVSEVGEWLARARVEVLERPLEFGWVSEGRISAFAGEDPFVTHGSLLHYIGVRAASDPIAGLLERAILAHGHASLDAFGGATHHEGVRAVEAQRGPAILADSAAAGRSMLASGIEVDVVSNSTPEKLARWFGHAALPYRVHPDRAAGALALRGGARKFVLANRAPEWLELGAARIDVARPHYREVLQEIRPGAVVGDVFSLDLALPLALKRSEPGWQDVRLFWLIRDYSPAWLRAEVERHAGAEVEILEDGLAGVAARLA